MFQKNFTFELLYFVFFLLLAYTFLKISLFLTEVVRCTIA